MEAQARVVQHNLPEEQVVVRRGPEALLLSSLGQGQPVMQPVESVHSPGEQVKGPGLVEQLPLRVVPLVLVPAETEGLQPWQVVPLFLQPEWVGQSQ